MQLKTIPKQNTASYESAKGKFNSAIDDMIDIGERLAWAKTKLAETGDSFIEWIDRTHPFKAAQAQKYIRVAAHKTQARQLAKDSDEPVSVNDLQKLLPKASEEPTQTEADPKNLGYVGSVPGAARNADDWHTPQNFVDDARAVMGGIDLDPFSSVEANTTIGATRIFTEADNALERVWADPKTKTVWMNPPYSRGASSKAVDKFLEEYDHGSFDQAIVLMNASTDTNWFHRLGSVASAMCLTKGRISFIGAGNKATSGNTKGQVFFYFGKNVDAFADVFDAHGMVLKTGVV